MLYESVTRINGMNHSRVNQQQGCLDVSLNVVLVKGGVGEED